MKPCHLNCTRPFLLVHMQGKRFTYCKSTSDKKPHGTSPHNINVVLHCKCQPAQRLDVLACGVEIIHSFRFCQHLHVPHLLLSTCQYPSLPTLGGKVDTYIVQVPQHVNIELERTLG